MRYEKIIALTFLISFGEIYGVSGDARNLKEDLQDFLNLIPVDKIKAIVADYAEEEEIQRVVTYLKSDEFEAIVVQMNSAKEVKELYRYMYDSGLDVYHFINKINDMLGIPHVEPENRKYKSTGRTFRQFLDEIEAILPFDDLKALFYKKLETSPDFKNLYDRLSSEEFHSFVQRAFKLESVQEMVRKLNELDVHVDQVIKVTRELFGWQ